LTRTAYRKERVVLRQVLRNNWSK